MFVAHLVQSWELSPAVAEQIVTAVVSQVRHLPWKKWNRALSRPPTRSWIWRWPLTTNGRLVCVTTCDRYSQRLHDSPCKSSPSWRHQQTVSSLLKNHPAPTGSNKTGRRVALEAWRILASEEGQSVWVAQLAEPSRAKQPKGPARPCPPSKEPSKLTLFPLLPRWKTVTVCHLNPEHTKEEGVSQNRSSGHLSNSTLTISNLPWFRTGTLAATGPHILAGEGITEKR